MSNDTGYAMDWDTEIANDGEGRTLFPDGTECQFEIIEMEKARTKASSKLANCPMAKLKLKCTNPEHGTTTVNECLVLHSTMEWKLCQFFTCIGQRQHGEQLRPRWSDVLGSKGRVKLLVEEYSTVNTQGKKEDRQSNKVDKWLEPSTTTTPPVSDDDF